jgi:N-sulfoglucosamine sulfohydrolase
MKNVLSQCAWFRWAQVACVAAAIVAGRSAAAAEGQKPNIMLITADDMGSWESVGVFGCPIPGVTPNIDRLASQGIRFPHAHCAQSICYPDRNAISTGRYPFRSGGEGFYPLRFPSVPILPDELKKAGYRVGMFNKVPHGMPYKDFPWDVAVPVGGGRNPAAFYKETLKFIQESAAKGQPFYLMNNSTDPHRPFYNSAQRKGAGKKAAAEKAGKGQKAAKKAGGGPAGESEGVQEGGSAEPSHVYTASEIKPWGFLPDLPEIRQELAQYYSSVRRCDDTLGAILRAIADAGVEQNTLVIFLSDNGPSFPFSKANCYPVSTRTPLILRWPGHIKPGTAASDMVCTVDLMPTMLEAAGVPPPPGMDGISLRPAFAGEKLPGRDIMVTVMGQTSGKLNLPARCVQDPDFCYIYNPWSDGKRICKTESQAGLTWKAMEAAAQTNRDIADRCRFYSFRAREEFYDLRSDPHCLKNLANDTKYAEEISRLRTALDRWMESKQDPALDAFRQRDCQEAQDAFLRKVIAELGGK